MLRNAQLLLFVAAVVAASFDELTPTHSVTMGISIDGQQVGNIQINLFGNEVPKTVENFATLCSGTTTDDDDEPLAFENSIFHRIIPGFMIQGGDFTRGDGKGGKSIWGEKFEDENFELQHQPYCLSMANSGPDTNGSQFFITVGQTSWLNGKHVVFGKVVDGLDVVKLMEETGSKSGKTQKQVKMSSCSVESLDQ